MPIASAVSAAGNIAATMINNASGKKAQKRQHEYNKQLLDKQLQVNKDMAQYNYDNFQSPLAQVRGYREAGLNENLAYSQLSSGQTSAETPEVPQNQAYAYNVDGIAHGIDNAINTYYKLQTQKEQVKLIKADLEEKQLRNAFTKATQDAIISAMNNKNVKEAYFATQQLNYFTDLIGKGGFEAGLSLLDPSAYKEKKKAELWQKQADWNSTENSLNRLHQLDMQTIKLQDDMKRLLVSHENAKELKRMDINHDESKFVRDLEYRSSSSEEGLYMDIAKLGVDALTNFGFGKLIKQGFKLFGKRRR